jgi:hypothetical protein
MFFTAWTTNPDLPCLVVSCWAFQKTIGLIKTAPDAFGRPSNQDRDRMRSEWDTGIQELQEQAPSFAPPSLK